MTGLTVILDGQFGSTGKGLLAYWHGHTFDYDWATTNSAPNSGHTAYHLGKKSVTHHLPMAAIADPTVKIYLNAGSVISYPVLRAECIEHGIDPDRLYIHPNAAVITSDDVNDEMREDSGATKIGSTRHGVGAAIRRKISRRSKTAKDYPALSMIGRISPIDLNRILEDGDSVLMEIPQGIDLSLNNSKFYPYVTSRDCTMQQGLADAAVHPVFLDRVDVCVRTFPIRVGSIRGDGGSIIGWSGPVWEDQEELSWEELGISPETTTVTGRTRRVFSWSRKQYRHMLSLTRPNNVFLNFCNYYEGGFDNENFRNFLMSMTDDEIGVLGRSVNRMYGFGPRHNDIQFGQRVL